jgi:hypothetical protein
VATTSNVDFADPANVLSATTISGMTPKRTWYQIWATDIDVSAGSFHCAASASDRSCVWVISGAAILQSV